MPSSTLLFSIVLHQCGPFNLGAGWRGATPPHTHLDFVPPLLQIYPIQNVFPSCFLVYFFIFSLSFNCEGCIPLECCCNTPWSKSLILCFLLKTDFVCFQEKNFTLEVVSGSNLPWSKKPTILNCGIVRHWRDYQNVVNIKGQGNNNHTMFLYQ